MPGNDIFTSEVPKLLLNQHMSKVHCLNYIRHIVLKEFMQSDYRERCGSLVECLTRDRGVAGLSLTVVTVLCP